MTPDQIDRLAAMGNAIRPDWPIASLRTFITNNLHWRAYGDTAVALAWIATKTQTETPRLLLEQSHVAWKAGRLDDPGHGIRKPPKLGEECRTHPGEYADACRPCRSEQIVTEDKRTHGTTDRHAATTRTAEHVAEVRRLLRNRTEEDA